MTELDCRDSTLRGDKVRDRRERLGLGIVPETAVARADPPFRRHRGRFRDHHRRTADRPAAEVDHVPVVRQPVLAGVLHIGETKIRLRKVNERICNGENNLLIRRSFKSRYVERGTRYVEIYSTKVEARKAKHDLQG